MEKVQLGLDLEILMVAIPKKIKINICKKIKINLYSIGSYVCEQILLEQHELSILFCISTLLLLTYLATFSECQILQQEMSIWNIN